MRLLHTPGLLGVLLLLGACGSAGLSTGPTVPTLVTVGGGQRAVVTVTDLDDVRDVAQSGERVFVATDHGLLVHSANGEGEPSRVTVTDGLPSNDVTAVTTTPEGAAVVATDQGIAHVTPGPEAFSVAVQPSPPVGRVSKLLVDAQGVTWACGAEGVARTQDGGWVRFGEPVACTLFAPTAEGDLWVGTSRGLWLVQGDVIREHGITRGIPEGFVRSVVQVGPGAIMALLQGPGDTKIGFYDGERWYAYTLAEFEPRPVALARHGGHVVLWVPGRAFAVTIDDTDTGVPLTPLSRSELRGVRAYRARITPPEEVAPPEQGDQDLGRAPSALAEVQQGQPTIDAPAFSVSPLSIPVPDDLYALVTAGESLFLSDRNRGVLRLGAGEPTLFQSRDLVDESDLQIAVDASGNTWVMGRGDSVGIYGDGRLERVLPPDGVVPQALANGTNGAYVMTRVETAPVAAGEGAPAGEDGGAPAGPHTALLRLYRVSTDGWTPEFERTVTTQTPLVNVPFFGIGPDERVWAALRVVHESGAGARMRGVAVLSRATESVVYHRRGATPETDGEGALSMPDEIEAIDLGMENYAWFPSLSGAVRLGNSQAVVFGEARGVRGEVVSDLAVADNERVWLAAAEGVGYYEASNFEFRLPRVVQEARPIRLAIDGMGNLWGAGPNGVVYFDGQNWQTLTEDNGLPTNELMDVEVDGAERVWLLARDRVLIFGRRSAPAAPAGG